MIGAILIIAFDSIRLLERSNQIFDESYDGTMSVRLFYAFLEAVIIYILSPINSRISLALTKWENHEYESTFESYLVYRTMAFEFVNNYSLIFYFMSDLEFSRIYVYVFATIAFRLIANKILSALRLIFKKSQTKHALNKLETATASLSLKIEGMDGQISQQMENQDGNFALYEDVTKNELMFASQKIREATVPFYMDALTQYGFIVMFSVACPVVPLLAVVNNILQKRSDMQEFLLLRRRHIPQGRLIFMIFLYPLSFSLGSILLLFISIAWQYI